MVPTGTLAAGSAPRRVLWSVFAAALAVRMGAALALDGLRHPEVAEYDRIAKNLLGGQGFTYEQLGVVYHSYIAPLPAWLSAGSYWLSGSLAPVMAVQIVAGASLAAVGAAVAGRLFGGWVAPAATGVLIALHPGLIVYSAGKAHSLAFDALCFTLALLQALRMAEHPTARRSAALGLIVGVGTLSRATIVIFLPITAAWLVLALPPASRRAAVRAAVVAGLCAAAVVAPWTIRNTLLHGRFVFLLTTNDEVFWRGNNPYATGTSYVDDSRILLEALPADEMRDLQRQPNELAQAEWFATRARGWIRDNPAMFVALTVKKFWYFWWFSPHAGLLYPRTWLHLYMGYYVAVLALAATGGWAAVRSGSALAPLALTLAFLLALSGLQSLYYVEGRHRWAVEAILMAVSGGGVAMLALRCRTRAGWAGRSATHHLV